MADDATAADCPHSERRELAVDYLAGRLSPSQGRAFEERYFGCPACARELEAALELRAAFAQVAAEGGGGPGAPRRRRLGWRWGASLAAAAPGRVLRGGEGALSVRVARGAGDPAGLALFWQPVSGADLYVVRLFAPNGDLLFDATTPQTRLVVTPGALAAAPPGAAAFARVEALDPLRRRLAASPLERVRSTPAPGGAGG
ncbi:MAG TPA: hypothetical protein VMT16_15140 [Thermoanaerobaculia bacterium]|nr:hypothetical protein [Thermoanaerobaculia bacterium]